MRSPGAAFDLRAGLSDEVREAIQELSGSAPLKAKSIHRCRVHLKRARALARVGRDVAPGLSAVFNESARAIMHALSKARDLTALADAARRTAKDNDGRTAEALNRIADTLTNIVENPHVGLLFLVPGATETFRVNGRATLTTDTALLAPCAVEGKVPRLGILVDVEQAYTQCSKAVLRSGLWDPERFVTQADLPSNGEIHRAIRAQHGGPTFDAVAHDAERAERYARREGFY